MNFLSMLIGFCIGIIFICLLALKEILDQADRESKK